jgi:hypothetical protein
MEEKTFFVGGSARRTTSKAFLGGAAAAGRLQKSFWVDFRAGDDPKTFLRSIPGNSRLQKSF